MIFKIYFEVGFEIKKKRRKMKSGKSLLP